MRKNGAQERTRTFTAVKPLAPEASASTNSATWALGGVTTDRLRACQIDDARAKYATARDMTARREKEAQAALIDQLQSALSEVKELRGFIPICAHCKKIRDDGGHWHGLEHYLCRHSAARFSHGVCPTCLDKHYGQMESSQLI